MDRIEASKFQLVRADQGGSSLIVSACGRSVPLQFGEGSSLVALQSQLQQSLHMEGQTFQFFDVQGSALSTDVDIYNAVTGGLTPLCATLTDASIHYIENRREELAQMQWKLIRDQVTGATAKVADLNRRVQEMSEGVATGSREVVSAAERLRSELLGTVEGAREGARGDLLQLSERVNAVSQLVAKERNVREVSNQGLEKQIQGLRDAMESDRSVRRQEAAATCSQIEDVRQGVELESRAREAFEDRQSMDSIKASERMDEMQSQRNDDAQDYSHQLKKASLEADQMVQAQGRLMMQMRSEMDSSFVNSTARLQQLEDRCATHEGRLGENTSRQMQSVERLSERIEKLSQSVEQVRLGERTQGASMLEQSGRIDKLEGAIKQSEADIREFCARERSSREQLMRSAQQSMAAEASLQVTAVKEELQLRLERESAARETSVQKMMEEVNAIQDNEDHKPPPMVAPPIYSTAQKPGASVRARSPGSVVRTGSIGGQTLLAELPAVGASVRARSPLGSFVPGERGSFVLGARPGGAGGAIQALVAPGTTLGRMNGSRSIGSIPVPLTVASLGLQQQPQLTGGGLQAHHAVSTMQGPLSPVMQMTGPFARLSAGTMPVVS